MDNKVYLVYKEEYDGASNFNIYATKELALQELEIAFKDFIKQRYKFEDEDSYEITKYKDGYEILDIEGDYITRFYIVERKVFKEEEKKTEIYLLFEFDQFEKNSFIAAYTTLENAKKTMYELLEREGYREKEYKLKEYPMRIDIYNHHCYHKHSYYIRKIEL